MRYAAQSAAARSGLRGLRKGRPERVSLYVLQARLRERIGLLD